tara:strand:- start:740 stop:1585 length:846 start_codon:yes stop_codon:yes gene_type:complete
MARNRIVKVETYTDQKLIELEIVERFLFIGMTNFADDEGIHINSPKMLKAEVFPADDIKVSAIEKSLLKMEKLGLIVYNEDRSLWKIKNFLRHQKINRPYPSKYEFVEGCNEHSVNTHGIINEQSSPNNNNKNKKKDNKKKNKEQNLEFDLWYSLYPRKIGKPKAENAFMCMLVMYDLDDIMSGTEKWVNYWKNSHTEKRYIPHPTTFINQERFMDEPDELEVEVEYRLDSTGSFYVGFCGKCKKSNFYRKDELKQDSKCCKAKILPSRDVNLIQDVNAEA